MTSIKIFALTLCCVTASMAQSPIDSLKSQLKTQNESRDRVKLMSHLGYAFFTNKIYDSAIYYCKLSLQEDIQKENLQLSASTFNTLGGSFSSIGQFDSSAHYYQRSLSIYGNLNDQDNVAIVESNLSILFKNLGKYEESLQSAFEALSLLERKPQGKALASCYNTIGLVYSELGDFEKSLTYHRKALHVRGEITYKKGIGQSLNNIGDTYVKKGNYDSALKYLTLALEVKLSIEEKPAATFNNIGEVLMNLGRTNEARGYFERSLGLRGELGDKVGKAVVLNNIGKVELRTKNFNKAESYILRAENLAKETGALAEWKRSLEAKIELYSELRLFDQALASAHELIIVKDSLLNKDKAESLLNMQTRYETEKKEQQIEILQAEKNLQQVQMKANQSWINGLLIFAVLLIVIVLLVVNQYRLTRKGKARIEILLNELHHRVKNNLQTLSSLFMLQAKQLTDHNAIQAVKSSEGRVNAMALIHRKLYQNNQSTVVNMRDYVDELVQYLVSAYGYRDRPFKLNLDIEEIRLDVDKAISLGLILNELMSNAFKYAFANNPDPRLGLHLIQNGKQEIEIELRDNGSGLKILSEEESLKSFGLRMVKSLLQDLKGRMETRSLNGTTILLNIPLVVQ